MDSESKFTPPIYDDVYFEGVCFLDMQDGFECVCGKHEETSDGM